MRVHELRRLRVLRRHVGIDPGGGVVRRGLRDDRRDPARRRIADWNLLVDVGGQEAVELEHRVELVERHGCAHVVDLVGAIADSRAERLEVLRHLGVGLRLRREHQRDRRLTLRFRGDHEGAFALRELDGRADLRDRSDRPGGGGCKYGWHDKARQGCKSRDRLRPAS
jgi:hypothetical protein